MTYQKKPMSALGAAARGEEERRRQLARLAPRAKAASELRERISQQKALRDGAKVDKLVLSVAGEKVDYGPGGAQGKACELEPELDKE